MEQKRIFNHVGIAYFLMVVFVIGVQLLVSKLITALAPQLWDYSILKWIVSLAPLYLIAMPICYIKMSTLPKVKLLEHGFPFKRWLKLFCICIFVMYVGSILGTAVNALISALTGITITNSLQEIIADSNILVVFVCSVILAPVLEELFFRKILIDRTVVLGDKAAIVLSGLLFGLFHGNFSQCFYAFGLGCILAYLYIRTGKLRYTVAVHMTINFFGGFLSTVIMKNLDLTSFGNRAQADLMVSFDYLLTHMGGILAYLGYLILMLVLFILGLVFLIQAIRSKKIELRSGEFELSAGKMARCLFGNAGIWLFLIGCGVMFYMDIFM